MSAEIKDAIDGVQSVFAEYKKVNDERLSKLATQEGVAELQEKQAKMDADMNALLEMKKQLEDVSAAQRRMAKGDSIDNGEKAQELKDYASGLKKLAKAGFNERAVSFTDAEQKAMSSNINPDGGYSIQPFFGGAEGREFDTSPLRALATVTTIGTNEYVGFLDDDELDAGWVGEKSPRPTTDTPELGEFRVPVKEMYCNPAITENLLEDSTFNLPAWIREKASDRFGRLESTAFMTGVGNADPRGILTYTKKTSAPGVYTRDQIGTKATAGATAITTDEIVDLRALLKPSYRGNAYFLYNRNTEAYIRKLKDGQGNYIWQPSFQAGEADMLLGQRTAIMEDMADIATGALSVALGDIRKSYLIVDRVGMSVLEDPYTAKPYKTFYMRKRVGGGLKNFDALEYLVQA